MRVLGSGFCGFIGHHVTRHLLENTDWEIVILDSLNYAGDVGRLQEVGGLDQDRVSIHWHDLRAPIGDLLAERLGDFDYIVNMASESHVDRSIADPVPFVHNNVMLALHMLEYARRVKPKAFVQISTDEVFGPWLDGSPPHKEWNPARPSNPYAASKASQEAIAHSYWRTYGVPVVITNTMNVFGPRQHPEKFIPLVISSLLRGEPVPVHGRWNPDIGSWESGSRFWLHARNHADALLYILNHLPPALYPQSDEPSRYNVVGDYEVSNLEIVEMVASILGVDPAVEMLDFHGSRPGHDLKYGLDGSKLRDAGWKPPVNLEQSFEDTVNWYADKWRLAPALSAAS